MPLQDYPTFFIGQGAASSSIIRSEFGSSSVNEVSSSSFHGTRFRLAGSCQVGVVPNNEVIACYVTATRGTKLSVQHVTVFSTCIYLGLSPGGPKKE